MEGGLWPEDWWTVFAQTYLANGMGGWYRPAWPDGRATLEQPALALNVFTIIHERVREHTEREDRG